MQKYEEYPTVSRWFGRLGESTQVVYENTFKLFMEWLGEYDSPFKGYSPDELIEYQTNCDNGSRYDLLDLIQVWVSSQKSRASTKKRYYAVVKSFFSHNRAELPRDPGYNIRSKKPPVRGTLTIEELKQVCLKSNKTYRAIFLSMFQGGMDQSSFLYWNENGHNDLVKQLKEGREIIKVDLPGRKQTRNKKPFYSFIGPDSVNAIRDYLKTRPNIEGPIFLNQFGESIKSKALRMYWIRKIKQLGLVEEKNNPGPGTRYGKNLHEVRDLFRSQWSKSPASHVVAEYCMGHVIDDLGYDKSFRDVDYYREQYKDAVVHLQIMSSTIPFWLIEKSKAEKEREDELKEMKQTINEMQKMINELIKNEG